MEKVISRKEKACPSTTRQADAGIHAFLYLLVDAKAFSVFECISPFFCVSAFGAVLVSSHQLGTHSHRVAGPERFIGSKISQLKPI